MTRGPHRRFEDKPHPRRAVESNARLGGRTITGLLHRPRTPDQRGGRGMPCTPCLSRASSTVREGRG